MLYTGQGDSGTTTCFGDTLRRPKDDPLFFALGSVDELNCLIGLYRHQLTLTISSMVVTDICYEIQECLFTIQGSIAGADVRLQTRHVTTIEKQIAIAEQLLPAISEFTVPGATHKSALLDHLRSVTRRVELTVLCAHHTDKFDFTILQYLNRLSSLWYALARAAAVTEGYTENRPHYR